MWGVKNIINFLTQSKLVTYQHIIIGRQRELRVLLEDINEDKKTVRLLIGESGVGKSTLLQEFYSTVKNDLSEICFIGVYDNINSLISESETYTYPISVCLGNMFQQILKIQIPREIKYITRDR